MEESRVVTNRLLCFLVPFLILLGTHPNLSSAQEILSSQQMAEEIEFVADLIRRVHPNPFLAGTEAEFNALKVELLQRATTGLPIDEFYFLLNQLPHFTMDGHTALSPPDEQYYLPLRFFWAIDGLIVIYAKPGCGLKFGDKILSFGGLEPDLLLKKMEKIIAAENIYLVREISRHRLIRVSLLNHLNLVEDGGVNFKFEDIEGNIGHVKVQLVQDSPPTDPILDRPLLSWNIDQEYSLGYFSLEKCFATKVYVDTLHDFFWEVKEHGINRVIVDLRRNPGGSSWVVNEFLSFLPVRSGGWFVYSDISNVNSYLADIKFSPEAAQQRGYSQTTGYSRANLILREVGGNKMKVPLLADHSLVFHGDIYILTSFRTCSSANWFAVIFQDNNLGTVLGEPTGGKPSHFGDVLHFTTPHSRLDLTISHKMFYRPDYTKDEEISAFPDIYVATTTQDIRDGRDPQIEALMEIFSSLTRLEIDRD